MLPYKINELIVSFPFFQPTVLYPKSEAEENKVTKDIILVNKHVSNHA